MPQWVDSDRVDRLPDDWPRTRLRILARDGRRCQHIRFDTGLKCGRFANEVDHILSDKEGGTDDDSNLQSLCPFHHLQKSGREGGLAAQRKRRQKERAPERKHPGLNL